MFLFSRSDARSRSFSRAAVLPTTIATLLAVIFLITTSTPADARGRSAEAWEVSYSTTYRTWDQSFYSTYSYTERTTYRDCGWNTCYLRGFNGTSWAESDTVYVRETIVDRGRWSGYHRVIVYSDSGYTSPYVTYYIDGGRRVVYRDYYTNHFYIYDPFTITDGVESIVKDFDSDLKALALTGGIALDVGVRVAAIGAVASSDDTRDAGLVIAGLGLGSAVSASLEQKHRDELRATELQLSIIKLQKQDSREMGRVN